MCVDFLARVASVSVGFPVHSRHWHFSVFGGAKIGVRTTKHFFAHASIFARPKSEKCFKPAESPTETLATQAMIFCQWCLSFIASRHALSANNFLLKTSNFFSLQLVAEGNSRCLCISDGSLLPVMAAKAGFEKVCLSRSFQCITLERVYSFINRR